jgi:predicted RNase H-like nuclease (RuvC/YqgF family)
VVKAEEKVNAETATRQRATRSAVASQEEKQMIHNIKAIEKQAADLDARLEEMESIVDQLNDTSTQPSSKKMTQDASKMDITKLTAHIQAVEKQLHAAIGATHKTNLTGEQKDRTPSVHSLFLSVEGFRKRLRSLEEMEGVTQCAKFLR